MAEWRRSTRSGNAGNCVEVATGIGIRDSKAPTARIEVRAAAWTAFLGTVKRGTGRNGR
jgi:hypothetical protein